MHQAAREWRFRPHPLLKSGHLQSFAGIYLPRRDSPYQALQRRIELEDGDQIVLHEDAPCDPGDDRPCVLMIHGLAGYYLSTYMCRMADRLVERNYRVFRMDMRGCGAGQQIARTPAHCGQSGDVAAALEAIAEWYPDSPTQLVGFSMGGTLALNLLAEAEYARIGNLERSLVICPPIDLKASELGFRTLMGRRYDRFFVRLLWKQVLARWQVFPDLVPESVPSRPKRLSDIDEMIIAPAGGFRSAEEYYQQTSPGPKLASICQPVTIAAAEDDPVVPVAPLHSCRLSPSVELVTTSHGGHLGFLGSRNGDPDFRWLDWRIIDWLQHGSPTQPAPADRRELSDRGRISDSV